MSALYRFLFALFLAGGFFVSPLKAFAESGGAPSESPAAAESAAAGPSSDEESREGSASGPSDSGESEPSDGGESGPSDSGESGPSDGGEGGPSDSGESGPADSGESGPADSGASGPSDSGESGPSDSGESGPAAPEASAADPPSEAAPLKAGSKKSKAKKRKAKKKKSKKRKAKKRKQSKKKRKKRGEKSKKPPQTISKTRYIAGGAAALLPGFGAGHIIQKRYYDTGWIFTVSELTALYGWIMSSLYGKTDPVLSYLRSKKGVEERDLDAEGIKVFRALKYFFIAAFLGFKAWEAVDIWILPQNYTAADFESGERGASAAPPLQVAPYAFYAPDSINLGFALSYKF